MGTHYSGPPREMAALDAYIKLMRAAESVTARRSPLFAADGLTVSQFGVLEALLHLGPLHQCDLSRKLLKSSGNITVVVDNLEKRGLVRRSPDREDRRASIVDLTEKGRHLIASCLPRHVQAIVEEMSTLSRNEQRELGRLCRRLGLRERQRT